MKKVPPFCGGADGDRRERWAGPGSGPELPVSSRKWKKRKELLLGDTPREREENRRASQSPHSRTASGGQHIDVRGHLAAEWFAASKNKSFFVWNILSGCSDISERTTR